MQASIALPHDWQLLPVRRVARAAEGLPHGGIVKLTGKPPNSFHWDRMLAVDGPADLPLAATC